MPLLQRTISFSESRTVCGGRSTKAAGETRARAGAPILMQPATLMLIPTTMNMMTSNASGRRDAGKA